MSDTLHRLITLYQLATGLKSLPNDTPVYASSIPFSFQASPSSLQPNPFNWVKRLTQTPSSDLPLEHSSLWRRPGNSPFSFLTHFFIQVGLYPPPRLTQASRTTNPPCGGFLRIHARWSSGQCASIEFAVTGSSKILILQGHLRESLKFRHNNDIAFDEDQISSLAAACCYHRINEEIHPTPRPRASQLAALHLSRP